MSKKRIDKAHVLRAFHNYANRYYNRDPRVRMKANHAEQVARISAEIARALGLEKEDQDTAWLIGVLHDIGHFEQLARYGTFFDSGSTDHAALGADLLFKEGLIRDYISVMSTDDLIECAIRAHNRYRLPKNLSDAERTFCRILRDADKVDILRIGAFEPLDAVYEAPEKEVLDSVCAQEVVDVFLTHHVVDHKLKHTPADFIIGDASLAFGLFYPESREILKENGYHRAVFAHPMTDPATLDAFRRLSEDLAAYLGA